MSTDRPTRDRPTDRQTDLKTDSDTRQTDRPTDRNQKIDRPTEPTVKSTYFVPAVKHRGGEWWWGDGVGPGSKAALNSLKDRKYTDLSHPCCTVVIIGIAVVNPLLGPGWEYEGLGGIDYHLPSAGEVG